GRNRVVLVGGWTGSYAADAWEWDGTNWAPLNPPPFAGRRNHAVAYDAQRDRLVLFGGRGGTSLLLGDTWEWDGMTWTQVAIGDPAPAAREGHALAYDAVRQ